MTTPSSRPFHDSFALARRRQQAIRRVTQHVKTWHDRDEHKVSTSSPIGRIVLFSGETHAPTPTASEVRRNTRIPVENFPLSALTTLRIRPDDVVIVEAGTPTAKQLEQLKTALRARRGAMYRGILTGDQEMPEEVGRPIMRPVVPGDGTARSFGSSHGGPNVAPTAVEQAATRAASVLAARARS